MVLNIPFKPFSDSMGFLACESLGKESGTSGFVSMSSKDGLYIALDPAGSLWEQGCNWERASSSETFHINNPMLSLTCFHLLSHFPSSLLSKYSHAMHSCHSSDCCSSPVLGCTSWSCYTDTRVSQLFSGQMSLNSVNSIVLWISVLQNSFLMYSDGIRETFIFFLIGDSV